MPTSVGQPASVYHHRVGEMLVTALNDGFALRPLAEGFIRNATLNQMGDALEAACMARDVLPITFTPVMVRVADEVILIDAGFADTGSPTSGFLHEGLAACGVTASEVTRVLVTHFHGDHINGLVNRAGQPVFPNARILVPAPEWAFWTDTDHRANAPEAMKGAFDGVERVFSALGATVEQYQWGDEVAPGILALDARGHTPGHTAYEFRSGGEVMIFISDTTNHPALFMAHPEWQAAFDIDPDRAVETRMNLLGRIADEGLKYAGYHVPFPAVGHLVRDGDGFRHVPLQWMAQV